jgi:hypothetical protein
LAAQATTTFDLPFPSDVGQRCTQGNETSGFAETDFNLFRMAWALDSDVTEERALWVVAPADGWLQPVFDSTRVRILHPQGYYSVLGPFQSLRAEPGPVRSGDILGSRMKDQDFEWGVHFVNPQIAERFIKDSQHEGISVPFSFRFLTEANVESSMVLTSSREMLCGSDATRVFRLDLLL